MNKKRNNIIIIMYAAIALIFTASIICLLLERNYMYILISGSLLVVDVIMLVNYLNSTKTNEMIYDSNIKYILKTFDSVLAYLDCKVDFDDKEIIKLETFDDLVNCQEEIKKPILYKYDDKSAFFMILDKKTLYYSILKIDDTVENEFEVAMSISDQKKNAPKEKEVDETILDEIERTTIIQTKNKKKYKVSPIIDLPKKKSDK